VIYVSKYDILMIHKLRSRKGYLISSLCLLLFFSVIVIWGYWQTGSSPYYEDYGDINRNRSFNQRKARFVFISDTHNIRWKFPAGDILIHAGDVTDKGTIAEFKAFNDWMNEESSNFKYKPFVVMGNHDFRWDGLRVYTIDELRSMLTCCTLLMDSSFVIDGSFKIFGSPWQKNMFEKVVTDVRLLLRITETSTSVYAKCQFLQQW